MQKAGHSPEAAAQLQAAEKENQRQRDRNLANGDVILGVQLLQKGEIAGGEAKLEEAVRLNPLDALAQHDYGLALLLQDKLDDAIARFRIALSLRPDSPDTLYYLGRALLRASSARGGGEVVEAGPAGESGRRARAKRARRRPGRDRGEFLLGQRVNLQWGRWASNRTILSMSET